MIERIWSNFVQGRRQMVSALFAIAAVQLVFWLLVQPVLFAKSEPPEFLEIRNPAYAALTAPNRSAMEAANYTAVELPHDGCCGPGYGSLRAEFELAQVPKGGLEMASPRAADNIHVAINGAWVYVPGRIELPDITYHGTIKSVIHIPASALRQGTNRIETIMVRSATPYLDVWPPQLAPTPRLSEASARSLFVSNEYRVLSYAIAGLVALLSLMVFLRSDQRALPFWAFILALAWGLRTHYYQWADTPFSGTGRLVYYFTVTCLIPMAWANVANEWTGRPWRVLRWLAIATGLAMIAAIGWLLLSGRPGAYDTASKITDLGGLGLGIAACGTIAWHLLTRRDERNWEAAILVLAITLLSSDFYKQYSEAKSNVFMVNTVPLLLAGFAVAFFARNIRLFRSINEINAMLSGQLKEREAELADQYAKQEELARRETLVNERQRLMRDMHDGVGGQLMSLLFAARQKALQPDELAQGLQVAIDELRLIIDSLDTVGESLGAALASFRGRIEPRLNAAGIAIEWSNTLPDDLPELPPQTILQIFRIVQEAITNAIKHSGTKAIGVTVGQAEGEAKPLRIVISDRGTGFDPSVAGGGRGVENMTARAASIGGTLELASGESGTTVTLTVPFPA